MYKDKDKQREAQRNWVRQKRIDKQGSTKEGSTSASEGLGLAAACDAVRDAAKPERTALGNIRVSKPGDADYEPQCETTREWAEGLSGIQRVQHTKPKRGKDIKCFADLPPDVQQTINRLSDTNEEKQKRTQVAIRYQHLFPDSYHSTGVKT